MTTNAKKAEDRLAKLSIHLPDAPTPFGAYPHAVQTGNLLFLSVGGTKEVVKTHEVNGPLFAHAILTTEGLLALLPATMAA